MMTPHRETLQLAEQLKWLNGRGLAILVIEHKLDVVTRLADKPDTRWSPSSWTIKEAARQGHYLAGVEVGHVGAIIPRDAMPATWALGSASPSRDDGGP